MYDQQNKYDLRERLLRFANDCMDLAEDLPRTFAGIHISGLLTRSGASPGLHYDEAQAAESPADFIHELKAGLKELRETYNCLFLIELRGWLELQKLSPIQKENNELISIVAASIKTAESRQRE